MATITRNEYVGLFGPTVGDRIRLGDTGLYVEIERDLRGAPGGLIWSTYPLEKGGYLTNNGTGAMHVLALRLFL